jgi:chromosome segregation ATPase
LNKQLEDLRLLYESHS